MRVLVDLNVLLDVIQRREPHYAASARALSVAVAGGIEAAVPGHAVTTLHYVVAKHAGRAAADAVVDWLLSDFEVVAEDKTVLLRARGLGFSDFEDAVVAAAAEKSHSTAIVTRNVSDFVSSPVPAMTPAEILVRIDEE